MSEYQNEVASQNEVARKMAISNVADNPGYGPLIGGNIIGGLGAASCPPKPWTVCKIENGFAVTTQVNYQDKVWAYPDVESLLIGLKEIINNQRFTRA